MKGGKAVGAGSYGCVFRPALLCEGETERSANTVTKLMNIENFKEEEAELRRISPYIAKVPNNEKYFVVTQIKKCVPKEYTREDLVDFNKICKPLTKGIRVRGQMMYSTNADYIERDTRRGYFVGLNLPDGGMDVFEFLIETTPRPSKNDLARFLGSFEELIQNGIRPMNTVGVCHFDMKAENMVYNPATNETKVIDWGFAKYTAKTSPAPYLGKPIMQNQPFTNLLFYTRRPKENPIIEYFIKEFLGKNKFVSSLLKNETLSSQEKKRGLINLLISDLRRSIFFNENSIQEYFGNRHVLGHYSYVLDAFFGKRPALLLQTMSTQIANVLIEFSYDERKKHFVDFDLNRFFHTVFKYNVDIYGALTVLHNLPLPQKDIKSVMNNLMFSDEYAVKPYVIEDVLANIQSLRELFVPLPPVPVPAAPAAAPAAAAPAPAAPAADGHAARQALIKKFLGIQTNLGGKKNKKTRKSKKNKNKKAKSTRKKVKRN